MALTHWVECGRNGSMWMACDQLDIGILSGSNSRPRKISGSFKHAVVAQAAALGQKASHLVESLGVAKGNRARRRGGVVVKTRKHALKRKTADKFDHHNRYQYWLAGREAGASTRHASMCFDGTAVIGRT